MGLLPLVRWRFGHARLFINYKSRYIFYKNKYLFCFFEIIFCGFFHGAFFMQAGLAMHCNLLPFHLLSEPDIRGGTYSI